MWILGTAATMLSLVGWYTPELDGALVLHPWSPTVQGFLFSHLYHGSRYLLMVVVPLVVLGGFLESRWGTPRFVAFYFFTAWGSSAATLLGASILEEASPSCGGGAVVLGSLVALGALYPDVRVSKWLPPVKHLVWVLVFLGGTALVGLSRTASERSFFLLPQMSGPVLAVAFIWIDPRIAAALERRRARRREEERSRVVAIRRKVDDLLEKITSEGFESLTRDERTFLRQASKHFKAD